MTPRYTVSTAPVEVAPGRLEQRPAVYDQLLSCVVLTFTDEDDAEQHAAGLNRSDGLHRLAATDDAQPEPTPIPLMQRAARRPVDDRGL